MDQSTKKMSIHVALSNNLNFKRVVGCQVFWPLKLWFLVWHVLKTMTTKTVGFGKFVWPDNCDIDLVERLRVVKILPKPQIKDVQDLVNLIERKKLKYKVQSAMNIIRLIIREMPSEYEGIVLCELID